MTSILNHASHVKDMKYALIRSVKMFNLLSTHVTFYSSKQPVYGRDI